jgi:GrpB-like predicted nucleotidyltransferase (UPF0157 family)
MGFLKKLGLKRNEVRLQEFTIDWIEEFERTKEEILQVIEIQEECIQHIGSTSIEGMKAKPIIDILVGVENIDNLSQEWVIQLKEIGFYQLQVEMENEIILAKFTDESFEMKTHYIHLTTFERKQWKEYIIFKEQLQSNPNLREEYIRIKEKYTSQHASGIKEYTAFKEEFVKRVIEECRV